MNSKFTLEERLEIGKEIYQGKLTREEAGFLYGIDPYTARDYFRCYKATVKMQSRQEKQWSGKESREDRIVKPTQSKEDYGL